MNAVKTLVLMQLKEKFNIRKEDLTPKKITFKIIYTILKIAAVTGICFGLLFLAIYLQLLSLNGIIPIQFIGIVFSIMLCLSIISCTFGLTKSMYYANDNPILLTLPCKPTQVYLSKLIVFYIYELIRNFSFMIPLFIAFGIINKLPIYFYPWLIFIFIFISMIPVAIGAILSIPMMWFYNFFRQYKKLQAVCLVLLCAGIGVGAFYLVSLIPENIDIMGSWATTYWKIQDLFTGFENNFSFLYGLTIMIVGERIGFSKVIIFDMPNFIRVLILLASIIVLFILGILIVKPLFYKMASKPFEYKRNNHKKELPNKVINKQVSPIKTELLLSIRDVGRLFSNVCIMIAIPLLIFFLNKTYSAMDKKSLGNTLAIVFNVLIILIISLSANNYAASIFSKDGRSSYLIKTQPSKATPLLLSKLLTNTIFMFISYVLTTVVLAMYGGLSASSAICLMIGCFAIYLAHLCYSAELDLMNPQTELYATVGNSENNPNETKSTVFAFVIAFVAAFMTLLFIGDGPKYMPYLKIMIIGLVFLAARIYMLLTKIKLYYKER